MIRWKSEVVEIEKLENSMIVGCFYEYEKPVRWEIQHQTYGGMEVLHWGGCENSDDAKRDILRAMKKYRTL